ncbi:MAG: gamma-glutamyltransferase [Hyphomicrobiales bacterium]|nr:gamma-glutamyltransferase [Hyphomicrobiales bacterium]
MMVPLPSETDALHRFRLAAFALFAFVPALAAADTAPVISPFATARPVVATHGMVVTQEAAASRVGLDVLRLGGNAIDAAVAVGFALAVTLPRAGNIGGGGFMLIHRADLDTTTAIDYRETAPAATTKDVFLDANGEADPFKSLYSGLAIGVPGTVAGLELAWRKYGSGKFTFGELVAPAAALARQGLTVGGDVTDSLPIAAAALARHPSSARIYLRPDGSVLRTGDHIALDDLAATLDTIAAQGAAGFYTGPVAEKIVAAVQAAGGRMTMDDLAHYRAVEREPVKGTYRGHTIVSMPPPSSGGAHVIEILNILEGFPLSEQGLNSAASLHEMAEAEKLAYADRAAWLGDPDFVKVPLAGLVSKAYADKLRSFILPDRARPAADIRPGEPQAYESDQTTHFSIVDADGNAVANTYTLNLPYGSGLVADGTGVLLNNELDDFAAKRGAANFFGLMGGDANAPGSMKRPLSSMSPTLVFKDGKIELATGSPGGSTIITTVTQIIVNVIDHGLNVAEAENAPRAHDQLYPDELRIERGMSDDTIRLLEAMGHKVVVREAIGSANTIARSPDGVLTGASDLRQRGTLAVGY